MEIWICTKELRRAEVESAWVNVWTFFLLSNNLLKNNWLIKENISVLWSL
jgi:hypothetical protein